MSCGALRVGAVLVWGGWKRNLPLNVVMGLESPELSLTVLTNSGQQPPCALDVTDLAEGKFV